MNLELTTDNQIEIKVMSLEPLKRKKFFSEVREIMEFGDLCEQYKLDRVNPNWNQAVRITYERLAKENYFNN